MSSLVSSVLIGHKPRTWSSDMSYASEDGVKCVQLSMSTSKYVTLRNEVYSSLLVEPTRIVRVQNPYLFGQYTLRKEQAEKKGASNLRELKLWHATSVANAASIVRTNFDWRRTIRSKFGQGVCFSPSPSYANREANRDIGEERALIRVRVLVNVVCDGDYSMVMPSSEYDTSTGNGNSVYVKYDDHEFYPDYFVYYNYDRPTYRRWRY